MLADQGFVEVTPNQAFLARIRGIEGFSSSDASMLLQITSTDGLPVQDFLVTRTAGSEIVGSFVDEANYANFTGSQARVLIKGAVQPAITDLAGKTFVCTSRRNQTNRVDT